MLRKWKKSQNYKRTPTFISESKVCLLSISDLADLAVYGVLSAIEGCDAFQDILNNTKVAKWYNRMKQACALKEGQSIFNGQDPVMEWHDCKWFNRRFQTIPWFLIFCFTGCWGQF